MVEGDIRELDKGWDLASYGQGLECYIACDWKPLTDFRQGINMIWREWYDPILKASLCVVHGEWIGGNKSGSKETT